MTLKLTPEIIGSAWDYICTLPPMSGWNLPPAEEIKFKVIRSQHVFGQLSADKKRYVIEISQVRCGRHITLLATLAHEACHMHQHSACFMKRNAHDRAFWALADQVCAVHDEFDRLIF